MVDDGPGRERPRAAFYVQHLLGIGHLARATRIAAGMAADGWEVDLIVGGDMPPGLAPAAAHLVSLPPVKAGAGGFNELVHSDGTPFGGADRDRRRDLLLAHVAARSPDVLLIEAFPFGRRQMRFELIPLLEQVAATRPRPLIVASIRDILQENRRPERVAETQAVLDRFFDLVLVHGDPGFISLEQSYPSAERFAAKVAYTGLVAPTLADDPTGAPSFDAVVSVGGGAVGEALLRAALAARPMTRLARGRWLFLCGPNLHDAARAWMEQAGAGDIVVSAFVPDLAAILRRARVSISQAGYNTVADLLAARCRAVLSPFAEGGETEQGMRADRMERQHRAVVVSEADLTPEQVARAVDQALDLPQPAADIALDGAVRTSAILHAALAKRHGRGVSIGAGNL